MKGIAVIGVLASIFFGASHAVGECERLKDALEYRQDTAPRDVSTVLTVVVKRINQELEGVVDVEVEWKGADLQGQVGEHFVECKVTRLATVVPDDTHVFTDEHGQQLATQCFQVPFTILDTNECTKLKGDPWRHKCHESSLCVNTNGSYECLCPRLADVSPPPRMATESYWEMIAAENRGLWDVSFNSTIRTSCPLKPSTFGCCPFNSRDKEGEHCRTHFRCPVDPCDSSAANDCAPIATCHRKASPAEIPNYSCQCPTGLMGNGHKCRPGVDPPPEPKVMFDGVTPTELTIKNNYYCNCTKPVLDACAGFPPCPGKHEVCTVFPGNIPKCACKHGFIKHEKFGCVDESPPSLKMNHDQTLRLKQGDVYQEYAVDIQDENAEEYLRSLKIAYSAPLPHGCLTKMGEFHVNYTVATPWTTPSFVRITRRVIIEDIDECSIDVAQYTTSCPSLVPQCDYEAGAQCVNTVGSYTCQCPQYTSGDGFRADASFAPSSVPEGFSGGTGCVDTSKPVIQLLGPNPKILRVCECGGIPGIMGKRSPQDEVLKAAQKRNYDSDIHELIRSTAGAELCATHASPRPNASDCVSAYDQTYKGRIDLSKDVKIGEPRRESSFKWSVPYNVMDEAGNEAITVWRDIVIQEVDLTDLEQDIRKQVMQDKEAAVQIAIEEDRKARAKIAIATNPNPPPQPPSCPACPKCDCEGSFDESMCRHICDLTKKTCRNYESSIIIRLLLRMEEYIPPIWVPYMLAAAAVVILFVLLRWTLTLIFNPDAYRRGGKEVEPDRPPGVSIQYHNGEATAEATNGIPPKTSRLSGSNDTFFSPTKPQAHGATMGPSVFSADKGASAGEDRGHDMYDDIYVSTIITPSKRGDGVRRRSPYSSGRGEVGNR